MDLFKMFSTDKRAENEGRKLVLKPDNDPAKQSWLLIARKGNTNYKEYLSKVLQENQAVIGTKTPEAEALARSIFRDAAARHLLLGWQNIDWDGVENVPYSVEQARKMLELDDFNTLVDDYASNMANYRAEEVSKEAKNSASI